MASGAATIVGPASVVVALAPAGPGREATLDVARHARDWGARVVEVGPGDGPAIAGADHLPLPASAAEDLAPLTAVAPVALLAFALARRRGPRPGPPRLGGALPQPGAAPHRRRRRRRHGGLRCHGSCSSAPAASSSPATCSATSSRTRSSRDAEIVLHDIDARPPRDRRADGPLDGRRARRRRPTIRGQPRPPRGARRRRLRGQHDPGRRRPGDAGRLRRPGPLRPALHDQRHDQRRRRPARPADDPGRPRRSPRTWPRSAPTRCFLNYTNPMGMLVRAVDEAIGDPDRRPLPLRLLDRPPPRGVPRRPVRGGRRPLGRRQPPRLDPAPRAPRARTSTRPSTRSSSPGACPDDDLVRADLFRRFGFYPTESSEHHAEYNPWFIPKGQVERVPRADRRVPVAGGEQPRGVRRDEAPPRRRRAVRDRAERRVRRGHRPRHDHGRAGPDRGQRAQRRRPAHPEPRRRRLRGGAGPRRRARRPPGRRRPAAAAVRGVHPPGGRLPGADRRGRPRRRTATSSTTPSSPTRRSRPRSRSTRPGA